MKSVKLVVKVLAWIVVLVLVAIAALPLWFGPVVKTVANVAVPGVVKTDFNLGHLSLNPYTARFELGDLNLDNPKGYAVKEAVKVGSVTFDAETLSLATDVIHIEEISIRDLFVSVVSGGENNVLNFKQIQYNVSGGKEKYEAAQSAREAEIASAQDKPPSADKSASEKPAKKVIIDRLEVSGLTIQVSVLPIRIPSVVLTDIGRKTGGATLDEAWRQILDGVMKSAGMAGDQLKALSALSGDAAKKTSEAVSKATGQATAAMNDASRQLSATTEKTTAAMGDATKKVSETTDQATKAVGEGAKKAMDTLKSLW